MTKATTLKPAYKQNAPCTSVSQAAFRHNSNNHGTTYNDVKRSQDLWEGDRQHGSPEQASSNGPRHTHFSVRKWEDFSTVCKWYRAFTRRVEGGEEVNEKCHKTQMGSTAPGNQGAETGGQQCPGHVGEREQKQRSAAKCIDCPDGGPSEDEVDQTKAERCEQRVKVVGSCLFEDGGGVESDNVDTAHLLGDHDHERCQSCSPDSRDGEQLNETLDVCRVTNCQSLEAELSINGHQVASCLDSVVPESGQRRQSLPISTLFHVPSRGLGTEQNENRQRDCRKECRSDLD